VVCIIAFAGIFLIAPEFSLSNDSFLGLLFGVLSALLYSFRNLIVKVKSANVSGQDSMFYQMLAIVFLFWPLLFFFEFHTLQINLFESWEALLILAVVTSAFSHTLFVRSFAHFSVITISLISNLTPLFGILIGVIFINEIPSGQVLMGGGLILSATFLEIYWSRKVRG